MATETDQHPTSRGRLTRERVLRAAVALADRDGIEALTMRNLAQRLGVEAMSLYHYVANKEALLDGVVEVIMDEIEEALGGFDGSAGGGEWKAALRDRILTARRVMVRHPWAPGVFETRTTMSLPVVRYFNGLLGLLREGGSTPKPASRRPPRCWSGWPMKLPTSSE